MIGALGTTLFFACNAIFANRSAKLLGGNRANLARLALAVVFLGAWAHTVGQGIGGEAFGWFFLSGLAGFGIGGVAMFQALPRLGSPLAMLIVQCGSAIVAAAGEWTWLGTRLTPLQLALVAVTLIGVALGLLPRSLPNAPAAVYRAGVAWAFLSATGQGVGAVLSRKAFQAAAAAHEIVDPPTSAYQRALAGLCVAGAAVAIGYIAGRANARGRLGEPPLPALPRHTSGDENQPNGSDGSPSRPRSQLSQTPGDGSPSRPPQITAGRITARAWPWVVANALCGPVLGVTCFQWALRSTPAGIVQSIVATAPLVTIPLAMWLEHSRPRALYYAGALLAVAGVAGLFLVR